VFEVAELSPSVFKATAIEIMRSSLKRPSELQAAKIAHDIYTKKGAAASELQRIFNKYH